MFGLVQHVARNVWFGSACGHKCLVWFSMWREMFGLVQHADINVWFGSA
jgi:hypothetical protein